MSVERGSKRWVQVANLNPRRGLDNDKEKRKAAKSCSSCRKKQFNLYRVELVVVYGFQLCMDGLPAIVKGVQSLSNSFKRMAKAAADFVVGSLNGSPKETI